LTTDIPQYYLVLRYASV